MHKRLRLFMVALLAPLIGMIAGVATASTPPSGTVSPSTPSITFTGGPFTSVNPSNNVQDEPDCSLVPNSCDDFLLTISIPPGYTATHPGEVVTVSVGWTTAGSDFDVYFYDASGTTRVHEPAATSANPEVAGFPIADGTQTVLVRILAFATVNASYTGTVTLGLPTGGGTPALGTYLASTDVWSCNRHLGDDETPTVPPTFDHNQDGEPSMKFDGNGVAHVASIAGVPAGSAVWRVTDACGQLYDFWGTPDETFGGGDTDIETSPEKNLAGFYNIYESSLTLANVTMSVSPDGGNTYTVQPISTINPGDDRQWLAAYGATTVWLSYRDVAGVRLEVVRWDNGGLGAPGAGPFQIWNPADVDPTTSKQLGNMACDIRPGATAPLSVGPNGEGTLYHGWTESNHKVWVSVSTNFGLTWTHHLVFDGGVGTDYSHLFTWVAVDQAGNVYTVFSDQRNVYYSASQDHGLNWSQPVRVSNGNETRSSVFPNVTAGSAGRILVSWYGTTSPLSDVATSPPQQWHVFTARIDDALAAVPTIEQLRVSDRVIHTGAVCEGGLSCPDNERQLLECFENGINPQDGSGFVVYGAFGEGGTYMTRQLKGKSSIAGKTVPDRSVVCPAQGGPCIVQPPPEDPCTPPGITVSTDAQNDQLAIGGPADDILKVSIAEPYQNDLVQRLVFTMQMAALDPNNLPPSRVWYILFTPSNGTVTYFVDMSNCDPTQLPYIFEYGTFDATLGFQTIGPTTGVVRADGTIEISIARSLVGNPPPGATLNGVHGDVRLFAGAACSGLVSRLDFSPNGSYTVRGNCAPVAALISRLEARSDDAGVELSWASYATDIIASWNVERAQSATGVFERVNRDPIPMGQGGEFIYRDEAVASGSYLYRLVGVGIDGIERQADAVQVEVSGAPAGFSFALSGPNPFRGGTQFTYSLPQRTAVRLDIFNVSGQRVRSLVSEEQVPGRYTVQFRLGEGASALAPGVYLAQMTAGKDTGSLRVVVLE